MIHKPGYFKRLFAALAGRGISPDLGDLPDDPVSLKSLAASLRLEIEERDERIDAMRGEYERLELSKDRSTASAGEEELVALMKKLAGPLANIAVLRDAAAAGEDVEIGDVWHLIASLEKALQRAGLESIGRSGETAKFDPAVHQRMSGGSVREGTQVTIEIPGYRLGERILQKALVNAEGNGGGEDRD